MKSSNLLRLIGLFPVLLLAAAKAQAASPDYTLHEWGTFTSVSGSDGVLLPGLELEEESLPPFVQQIDGPAAYYKGFVRPLRNVTIKMETPVIYFYTNQPFAAQVHVGFNGGSISQWYPARSGGEPVPAFIAKNGVMVGEEIDFAKPYKGAIDWKVNVQPASANDGRLIFKPGETPTWLYPRQTDSALVRTADGAAEKYLFYRGVGNFSLPVKFTMPDDNILRIQNNSKSAIPALLIFNHAQKGDNATFSLINPIEGGETRTIALSEMETKDWRHGVYDAMRGALVSVGLFPKEADAMVQTWWASYFERPGLRVFWIVPEAFTQSVLPLKVDPAPTKQVRVLVGRSELLTPSFEYELPGQLALSQTLRSDRFFGAYQARVNALKAR